MPLKGKGRVILHIFWVYLQRTNSSLHERPHHEGQSRTLQTIAHSFDFVCTDVSTPFTGYEPKARKNNNAVLFSLPGATSRDNHEAVKVGDLGVNMESTDFLEAVVREGADELTLRAEEEHIVNNLHRHHECGRQKVEATARG